MTFGRKIHDGTWLVLCQQLSQHFIVTNICLHKDMSRIRTQTSQIFQIAGVGQFINIDNGLIHIGKPLQYKIRTNKTCTASDKNHKTALI